MNKEIKSTAIDSFSVTVYIAGDATDAVASLRRQCLEDGLCVTVTLTRFIYTGGVEDGVAVGFVNYPRFPKTPEEITTRAIAVANILIVDMCQLSALVVTPNQTVWLSRRD